MKEKAINIIKNELKKFNIKVLQIILFGSRARGDYSQESDWDFFVIIDKKINFYNRKIIKSKINQKLASFNDTIDVKLEYKDDFDERKKIIGYIAYDVKREGKLLWQTM